LIILVRLLLFLHPAAGEKGQESGRFNQAVGTYFDLLSTRRANYGRDEVLALE